MPARPGKPVTVARAAERYATWIRGNYSKGSLPSMLSVLRRFGEQFDGALVTEVTSGRLAEWKADRMLYGAAGATIAREVSVIRGFFEWLLDEGLIDRNPATKPSDRSGRRGGSANGSRRKSSPRC